MLRRLTFLVIAAAVLYSGYWFLGARTVRGAVTSTAEDLRLDGWDVAYEDLSVSGFPNLFDTRLTAPRLAAPGGAPAWSAAEMTVYALSYRPNEVIALFPALQEVSLPDQTVTLSTANMRASAKVSAALDLPLDNVTVESGPFSAASSMGWELIFDAGLAAFRTSGPAANAYDVYLRLDEPSLDGVGVPGLALDGIVIDAQAIFEAPLDRHAAAPRMTNLSIRSAGFTEGDAALSATGDIGFAGGSAGDGQIDVTVTGWRELIDAFETAGVLPAQQAETLRSAAGAMSGGDDAFTAPITVTDGALRFGFIPLGTLGLN